MANAGVAQTQNSALNFMSTLQGEQNQAFAGNQTALNAVQGAWGNVLAGGAIPEGYSPGLDSLLQSKIINQGATNTANAENASALQQKQASGGANVLPTGANAAINAGIEAKGQQSTAENLTNEKIADYSQGITNLGAATTGELGVASGENEVGLAGAASGAGVLGLSAAQARWQENQTSSPAAILGDVGAGIGEFSGAASDAAML